MTTKLAQYGLTRQTENFGKAGKVPASGSLVTRMPSPEVAAKVGGKAAREVASCRVVRLNKRG